jgi:Na+-driven multidrug efflux pump
MLGASTWLGAFTALLAFGGARWLLGLMHAPAEVLPLATPFLQALAAAMLFDAWNASMASVMRAHLRTRDTLAVLAAMHVSHLALAVPLMYGWGPLPALGLPGFAFALLISRVLGLVLHLMLWRRHLDIHPVASDWWKLRRAELAAVLHIGVRRRKTSRGGWPSWPAWRWRARWARSRWPRSPMCTRWAAWW